MQYVFQGISFLNNEYPSRAQPSDGVVTSVNEELCENGYSGVIWWDEGCSGWRGVLMNIHGCWILTDVRLSMHSHKLSFRHRSDSGDEISYVFEVEDGNTFVGGYMGEGVSGLTRCLLTPVEGNFFNHAALMKKLDGHDGHDGQVKFQSPRQRLMFAPMAAS